MTGYRFNFTLTHTYKDGLRSCRIVPERNVSVEVRSVMAEPESSVFRLAHRSLGCECAKPQSSEITFAPVRGEPVWRSNSTEPTVVS
jgi:hypothetical protein